MFWLFLKQQWSAHACSPSHCDTVTNKHAGLSQPPASGPYRFSQSRLAEKTEKSSESLPKFPHRTDTNYLFWWGSFKGKVHLRALFFLRKMPTQLNIKLCLSSVNNLSFNIWPQIGYDFHLLLIMLSKYCTGTSTILLRAIFPLCDYYIIQGRGRNASEIKASL